MKLNGNVTQLGKWLVCLVAVFGMAFFTGCSKDDDDKGSGHGEVVFQESDYSEDCGNISLTIYEDGYFVDATDRCGTETGYGDGY